MNPHILRQPLFAPAGENEFGGGESDTTGTMAQAREKLSSTARETAARIKSAAGDTASRAKTEAQHMAEETKESTASRLGGYGSAMHESARSLEEQDPNLAWATHQVADRIERAADYVRQADFGQLRRDAENLARRHPVAFFGGLFLGGIIIGNLLKARTPSFDDSTADQGWDRGNASGSEALGSISDPSFPSGA